MENWAATEAAPWYYDVFVSKIRYAHSEHLKTGDYRKLGMDTQDCVRWLERMKEADEDG